jgi:hypothetical protein
MYFWQSKSFHTSNHSLILYYTNRLIIYFQTQILEKYIVTLKHNAYLREQTYPTSCMFVSYNLPIGVTHNSTFPFPTKYLNPILLLRVHTKVKALSQPRYHCSLTDESLPHLTCYYQDKCRYINFYEGEDSSILITVKTVSFICSDSRIFTEFLFCFW